MSVNKCIFVGNLTKNPELKYTPQGTAVCTFSIACNERFKDRDGNKQERVEYINIVAWRQLAEICGNFLQKGKQVYIEGKIQTRSYDDRDGNKRYITEIVADQMQMLGSKSDDQGSYGVGSHGGGSHTGQAPANQQTHGQTQSSGPAYDDSDLPF